LKNIPLHIKTVLQICSHDDQEIKPEMSAKQSHRAPKGREKCLFSERFSNKQGKGDELFEGKNSPDN